MTEMMEEEDACTATILSATAATDGAVATAEMAVEVGTGADDTDEHSIRIQFLLAAFYLMNRRRDSFQPSNCRRANLYRLSFTAWQEARVFFPRSTGPDETHGWSSELRSE